MRIDKDVCVGCGICLTACSFNGLRITNEVAQFTDDCIACGACVEVCPTGAIISDDIEKQEAVASSNEIWVLAEHIGRRLKDVSFELIAQALRLNDNGKRQVVAILIGTDTDHMAHELIAYGADKVLVVDSEDYIVLHDQLYAKVLSKLAEEYSPDILLVGATSFGRSVAPCVSVCLGTGLTADCTMLEICGETGVLLQTRPAFGGNLMATIACQNHKPQMASVRPRVFKRNEPDFEREGVIKKLNPTIDKLRLATLKERIDFAMSGGNIANADVVVGVGKGIGNQRNIKYAEHLAKQLGGVIGASRSVVEQGWVPYAKQIGQTGSVVTPKLYIACGISGAIQHLMGIGGSELVIAINIDADAPIFGVAHYGIVGDCVEIISEFSSLIQKEAGGLKSCERTRGAVS